MYEISFGDIGEDTSIREVFVSFFGMLYGEDKKIGSSFSDFIVAVFAFFALVVLSLIVECTGYSAHNTYGIVDRIDSAFPFVRSLVRDMHASQQNIHDMNLTQIQHGHISRGVLTSNRGSQTEFPYEQISYQETSGQNFENNIIAGKGSRYALKSENTGYALARAIARTSCIQHANTDTDKTRVVTQDVTLQPCFQQHTSPPPRRK